MGLFDLFKKKVEPEVNPELNDKEDKTVSKRDCELAKTAFKLLQEDTKKSYIEIDLIDEKPTIFDGKFGGIGYVPKDGQLPADNQGRQLRLLAQIDFSKVELEDFPKQGLLQFWILNDDCYGCDFENLNTQNTFRIIYYKDIDKSVTEEDVKAKVVKTEFDEDEWGMPVKGEYGLKLTPGFDSLPFGDYIFEDRVLEKFNSLNPDKKLAAIDNIYSILESVEEEKDTSINAFGHKIDGYPAFTQTDPREDSEELSKHDVLLLQIDTDYEDNVEKIMFGDSGVCNFFINREKLKKLDFSDVIYNWDCY